MMAITAIVEPIMNATIHAGSSFTASAMFFAPPETAAAARKHTMAVLGVMPSGVATMTSQNGTRVALNA